MPAVGKSALLLIVALCIALGAAGCGSDDSSTDASSQASTQSSAQVSQEVTTDPTVGKRAKPKVQTPSNPTPTQLEETVLIEGTGVEAKKGDLVEINFIGVAAKTGKEFENSWDLKDPLFFRLGSGEVIEGWEQGIEGMKVGERRELVIPPKLGFPSPPDGVAKNEALVYVIDLIGAREAPNAPKAFTAQGAQERDPGSRPSRVVG